MTRQPLVVALLLVAGVLLAACSASAEATPTPPSATSVRDRTVAELRGLSTVHFSVSHETGGTDLGAGMVLVSAEGDALFPDRAELTAQTTLEELGVNLEMRIVQIADQTYLRDPVSSVWRAVEQGTLPFNFVGMHHSLADALTETVDLAIADGGERDGVATRRLTGTVSAGAFSGLVPSASDDSTLALTAWIGKADALPRDVRLVGVLVAGDPAGMTRLMRLRDFNRPVTVEPPL